MPTPSLAATSIMSAGWPGIRATPRALRDAPGQAGRGRCEARRGVWPACLGQALVLLGLGNAAWPAEPPVRFTSHIRPILASKCFACHGPDERQRQADLRLDEREVAIRHAIVPGNSAASELVARITSDDPDYQMPPPASKKGRLTREEVALVRTWIDQGAAYDAHWAYQPPRRPALPDAREGPWPATPIDAFLLAPLQERGLSPAPPADRRTLLRRLSWDVRGLPPTPEEVAAFLDDQAPDAWERQVDRMLATPQFGERMAIFWLDVVRFADTGGYHSDNHRDIWAYRDWVIDAFNHNLPFDQFTIEQLAGDLLAGASDRQRIASGFNRLLQTTEEGGAQPKEYAAKYAADRVRNTAAIWLGTTLGCCECHDHKFDPFTQADFYALAAFFADIDEKPVGRQTQTLLPTPEQAAELARLEAELAAVQAEYAASSPALEAARQAWEEATRASPPAHWPANLRQALATAPSQRTAAQTRLLDEAFRQQAPELAEVRQRLAALKRQQEAVQQQVISTLVTRSVPPRVVRILPRGNWLDESGPVLQPALPASLAARAPLRPGQGPPRAQVPHLAGRLTRLDLALWLVQPDHPLTGRVLVNRLWKLFFGRGIVRTLDDFGLQSDMPTHPQLLDWLAVELADRGWDVKHVLRQTLASQAYRQAALAPAATLRADPTNDLFGRQQRWRLEAELVRDTALAASGLLTWRIGGPSVKPYQPAGYWQYLNFPPREWVADRGPDQYRRGLYTYWQRTFLHPSLAAFDAPSREECTAQRPQSNTPQQALVLLNDPSYVEAARFLAAQVIARAGADPAARVREAMQRVLQRDPKPEEVAVLVALARDHQQQFAADATATARFLQVGDWAAGPELSPAELAAWTNVCRVLLNLSEAITRP
jgi:hypothetical protein